MKRREMIKKVILGGTTFIILTTALDSCSKDKTEPEEHTFTIDLTDTKYAALNTWNGYMVIASAGLIVDNSFDAGYNAADSQCPNCANTLEYVPYGSAHWTCPICKSYFNVKGEIMSGPAITPLKVYRVTKMGNILTIHLGGK
jgi:cytochrome b6-f complex iron-sulfur subunit